MRIALGVQYDGRGWQGWQSQPGGRTVQDALERALCQFADRSIRVQCAGRTDTGVHALGQVAHFETDAVRKLHGWVHGTNALLPESIAVSWCRFLPSEPPGTVTDADLTTVADRDAVEKQSLGDEQSASAGRAFPGFRLEEPAHFPGRFSARFSAISRTYHYVLFLGPVRSPLLAGRAGWYYHPLDVGAMQAGARELIGTHDFSAFRGSDCQAKTPVKTLHRADVAQSGAFVVFTLRADAFLHHMVRNIVGSLISVGRKKFPPERMRDILDGRDRTRAAPTFMPDGLYLAKVEYPERFAIPEPAPLSAVFPGLLQEPIS